MHVLTEDACKKGIIGAGVDIDEHYGGVPGAVWHEVRVSEAASYDTAQGVGGHEAAFNLASCLLLADSSASHGWILWLLGRVYTNDRFMIALFQLLNQSAGSAQSRVQAGYFFEESDSELCAAIVALVMLAGWDAVVARADGSLALTLEHDGRMFYQIKRSKLQSNATVREYLDHFGFRGRADE